MAFSAFVPAYPPSRPAEGQALWLPFYHGALLLPQGNQTIALHRGVTAGVAALNIGAPLYLGTLDGVPVIAGEAEPEDAVPAEWQALSLRALFGQISEAEYVLVGYASQMLYWRRTSVYCPVCGHATEPRKGDWGRHCPACDHVAYPHVTPATLILVQDLGHGDPRLLLAHKPGWGTRYSILAGFVEPGESLEECVRREVREEVGLEVAELRYAGSQPWPYPHQLMIGFTARYAGGEIRVDGEELDQAGWFTPKALPDLPSAVSLSRQMIDSWVAEQTEAAASFIRG